jgi:c(7)-type cytochrome triheme protein
LKKSLYIILVALVGIGLFAGAQLATADSGEKFKGIPSNDDYGSLVLNNKTGEGKGMSAVVFPHWWHRSKFTCKVCHTDLGFPMKAGTTDFVMSEIFAGKQCGACHDGKTAFAPTDCNRCHSMGQDVPQNRTIDVALRDLPKDNFGNGVDWVEAVRDGSIEPKASIDGSEEMNVLDKDIIIPMLVYSVTPPAVLFPHKAHTEWLDCKSCHPELYPLPIEGEEKVRDEDRKKVPMTGILAGQSCGTCHGKVSFPMENCFRCHSQAIVDPYKKERSDYVDPDAIDKSASDEE